MTSPLSPLVRLTLFTQDEQTTVDNCVAAIKTLLPTWTMVEGNTEAALIEASALQIGLLQYTINQLGQYVLDNLIALWGIPRLVPAAASGFIQVSLSTTIQDVRVMPVGSRFRLYNPDGSTLDFVSSVVASNTPGAATFVVPVVADGAGSLPNSVATLTPVVLLDVLSWVDSATTYGAIVGGTDPETDGAYYARVIAYFAASNRALVLPRHFSDAALNVAGVGRATVVNNWDGAGTPGAVGGSVAVAVATAAGGLVSAGVKTTVGAVLTASAISGLTVVMVDPVFKVFTVTASVVGANGTTPADLTTRITAAVQAYLSPANRDWGKSISINQLIVVIGAVAGVDGVSSVTGTVGGVAIGSYSPGVLDLPTTSATVTVTVA